MENLGGFPDLEGVEQFKIFVLQPVMQISI
jgi:hypothetical protein